MVHNYRTGAALYAIQTWFVSGTHLLIPCIKVTMMMIIIIIFIIMMMMMIIIIIKSKVHPRRGHEGPEGEQNNSSTLSLTSVLDGVGGQCHDPATLPPGKNRYQLYSRLGGPQGRSGGMRKISPPPDSIPGPSNL